MYRFGTDIEAGIPYLARLLAVLPKLEVIVLVGKKAQMANNEISKRLPSIKLVNMPHPALMFINRLPGNRARILSVLQEITKLLTPEEKCERDAELVMPYDG